MTTLNRKPIRILCVDDHAFLIDGLQARFSMEKDFEVVGRLHTADGVVDAAKRCNADIVLLDIEMPGCDPFESAADLKRRSSHTKVIILSAHVRDHYIEAAYKAGCWGYFSKADETATIVDGIRKVAKGEFAMGPKVQERVRPTMGHARTTQGAAAQPKLTLLTARELEVLRLIGRGLTRSDIAKTLSRSPKTIDGHREIIMKKLDIHDRAELVRFAIREGLVEA